MRGIRVTWACHRRVSLHQLRSETSERSSPQSLSTSYMAPKASTSKRPASTRKVKATEKAEDVEDLAHRLASKLTISKSKEKQRAIPDTPLQGDPNTSMRAINVASQNLSALVQTGWTAAKDTRFSKQGQEASTWVGSIKKNLNALRETVTPSPLDLERAALSAVGKLLALQLVRPHKTSAHTLFHSSMCSSTRPWIYYSTCIIHCSHATLTALIPRTLQYHRHLPQGDFSPGHTSSTSRFPSPLLTRSP